MKKKVIIIVIVVLVLAGGAWWFIKGRGATPPESTTPSYADVKTTVSVNATYTPEHYAAISAETPLKIANVDVAVGDTVTAGQAVVHLDRAALDAQVQSAKLAVDRAVLTEQRGRLASSNLSSKEKLSLKKASEQARQSLVQIVALRQKAILTSPMDGIVTVVNARDGEVGTGTLVRVIDPDSLSLEAYVSETDVVGMRVDQEATMTFDALSATPFTAQITQIDPEAVSIQDVIYFRTLFNLKNPTKDLRPGMTGDVDIITASKEHALTLPLRFIRRDDTGQYVSVSDGKGSYTNHYITTGIEGDDGLVEIIDGLDAHTTVYAIYND